MDQLIAGGVPASGPIAGVPALAVRPGQEKGFAFRVPPNARRRTADRMRRLAQEHPFEVDHVGLLGGIRCTYRHRDEDAVQSFLAQHMRETRVRMIEDYQRRYGAVED